MDLPLNALRAFEVAARHLSFTRAAHELNLTQTAVSQHVKNLEQRLGRPLFRRVPRGLVLTDEGVALLPALVDAFARMSASLESFKGAQKREVLTVGAVGTFAVGWLLPRLRDFQARHPFVELRLLTHNNRIDLASEGLDCAIRFGDGQWPGMQTTHLLSAPLAPVCAPSLAHRVHAISDLGRETLLRSYRADEWTQWFEAAGKRTPLLTGPMFDSSLVLADAAAQGA
jgi:LysR family transcriptional regulator, regulator of gene expression of beta-lactamase